jgi:hypothetical protein
LKRKISEELKIPLTGVGEKYIVDEKKKMIKSKASVLLNATKMPPQKRKEAELILNSLLGKSQDFVFTVVSKELIY